MSVKAQKELELKVHDEFYKNVHTLTLVYPPSTSFQAVFKKDMFIKNNKAGFHQVVYYLLEILDTDKLKQKVPSWPPYDLRLENQFRNEVMKYINELNSIYEDANIPPLATSHVISPGGFKFAKFMFKLSQLVLFEHLKRDPKIADRMLLPMKPCKREFVTSENLEKLRIVTNKMNMETEALKSSFEKQLNAAKLEAQKITQEQCQTNKSFKESNMKLDLLLQQFGEEILDVDYEEDRMRLETKKKLETLKMLQEKFKKCETLALFLGSSDVKLEHDETLNIPAEINHFIYYENKALDFLSVIEGCNKLIDRKRLEVKPVSDKILQQQIERFGVLNDQLTFMTDDLEQIHAELAKLSSRFQKAVPDISTIIQKPLRPVQLTITDSDSTTSTELAIPLSSSPSPKHTHEFIFDKRYEENVSM